MRGAGIPLLAQPEVGEGGGWISRLCLGKRTHRVSVTYVVHCLTDGIWRGETRVLAPNELPSVCEPVFPSCSGWLFFFLVSRMLKLTDDSNNS